VISFIQTCGASRPVPRPEETSPFRPSSTWIMLRTRRISPNSGQHAIEHGLHECSTLYRMHRQLDGSRRRTNDETVFHYRDLPAGATQPAPEKLQEIMKNVTAYHDELKAASLRLVMGPFPSSTATKSNRGW